MLDVIEKNVLFENEIVSWSSDNFVSTKIPSLQRNMVAGVFQGNFACVEPGKDYNSLLYKDT